MKKVSTKGFASWINELGDANTDKLMEWFAEGKTFAECCAELQKSWHVDEIANAFVRAR